MSSGGSGHESAHAVPNDDDAARIDAVFLRVGWVEKKTHLRVRIFCAMLEREITLHSPGAAVMHGQHVPAVRTKVLRNVQILLKSRKAVEDDGRGMRPCAGSKVENAKQHFAVAGQNHLFGRSGLRGGRWTAGFRL